MLLEGRARSTRIKQSASITLEAKPAPMLRSRMPLCMTMMEDAVKLTLVENHCGSGDLAELVSEPPSANTRDRSVYEPTRQTKETDRGVHRRYVRVRRICPRELPGAISRDVTLNETRTKLQGGCRSSPGRKSNSPPRNGWDRKVIPGAI